MKWLLIPFLILIAGCDVRQLPQDISETVTPVLAAPTPSRAVSAPTPAKIQPVPTPKPKVSPVATPSRDPIDVAASYLGETEDKGPNRSTNIDRWNKAVGVPVGSFWCASFVSNAYREADYNAPFTAWSPGFFERNLIPFKDIQRNDSVGYYFKSKGRIAHIGLVEKKQGNFTVTIEGNTSPDESIDRNGGGVYRKFRNDKLLSDPKNKFSRYLKK